MPKDVALEQAARRAAAALRGVDLVHRCQALQLPAPSGGCLRLRVFGVDTVLQFDTMQLFDAATGRPVRAADRVLVLHYLMCERRLQADGHAVAFRAFPGGRFYEGPFRARTVKPLVQRFGDDLAALRAALGRVDWSALAIGDLGARIHAFGALYIELIYRRGDDEFGPAADVLFSPSVRHAYGAEDAAVLASRICLALL